MNLRRSAARLLVPLATGLSIGCGIIGRESAERPDARIVASYPLAAVAIGTVDGVTIRDGGYSALALAPGGGIWVLTDRGPNLEAAASAGAPAKRFPIAGYTPQAERLVVDSPYVRVAAQLPFRIGGRAVTGLPPPGRDPAIVVERALGADFGALDPDADGIDSEGIAFGGGRLWISEEYRPSIWALDSATGELITRYTPTPVGPRDRALPTWLLERAPNLGFEGLTVAGGYLYVALQGPLRPPGGDRATALTRILRLDPATDEVRAYVYALDASTRKIGDLSTAPDGRLLVLEHGVGAALGWSADIYAVDPAALTAIDPTGLPPERFRDVATALTGGVLVAPKTLYVDLMRAGWSPRWDKPEGLAIATDGTLLLVNDNDYGLDSPQATGAAVATNAETVLVLIK